MISQKIITTENIFTLYEAKILVKINDKIWYLLIFRMLHPKRLHKHWPYKTIFLRMVPITFKYCCTIMLSRFEINLVHEKVWFCMVFNTSFQKGSFLTHIEDIIWCTSLGRVGHFNLQNWHNFHKALNWRWKHDIFIHLNAIIYKCQSKVDASSRKENPEEKKKEGGKRGGGVLILISSRVKVNQLRYYCDWLLQRASKRQVMITHQCRYWGLELRQSPKIWTQRICSFSFRS